MQSLLQGLPIAAQSVSYAQPSNLSRLLSESGGILKFLESLGLGGGGDDRAGEEYVNPGDEGYDIILPGEEGYEEQ